MRIKKIKFNNHNILGNLELDFTNKDNEAEDIIFLAGENGTGKTTIVDNIFDFISANYINNGQYGISYTLELNEDDIRYIKGKFSTIFKLTNEEKIAEITIESFSGINKFKVLLNGKSQEMFGNPMRNYEINKICKCIYTIAEINFTESKINSVTSMELDEDKNSEKQASNMSHRITQLLVDIKATDDADLADWVNNNPGKIPPEEIKEKRIKRFKNAFKYMFEEDLCFDCIKNFEGHKEIYFRRKDKLISINQLSSGEKQIVYRGAFILKNVSNLINAIILIDEPELSLHPMWQQKIIEYFRRMCIDDNGKQVCQIIVTTHSPFILHNKERKNDKVIILKRDDDGNIYQPENKEFYKCDSIGIIEEAFSLNNYLDEIRSIGNKTIIITEGKTDNKHLKIAMKRLGIENLDISFMEIPDQWGDSKLEALLQDLKLISRQNKIIGIFDRDKEEILRDDKLYDKEFVELGNNVYAFAIPIVRDYGEKISIEHYYKREDLKKEDINGRRLFLGEEFIAKSSMSYDKKYYTKISKIQNKVEINGVIDEKVYNMDDVEMINSVVLSKNDFADLVANEEFSKDFDFSEFQKIFDVIEKIIKN